MEYDKHLISLYDSCPLPKMFIILSKRADVLTIELNSSFIFSGVLFVCSGRNVMYKEIKSEDNKLILNPTFNFKDDYIFCFMDGKNKYVGEQGTNNNKEKVLLYFAKLYISVLDKKKQALELGVDKEYVTTNLISKVFASRSLLFFEQTKKQLSALFASCSRAKDLEQIIPYSKFIYMGEEGERAYVGVVYKENQPFAIGIGYDAINSKSLINEGVYQYFYKDDGDNLSSSSSSAFYLSFRSAADGSVIWLK